MSKRIIFRNFLDTINSFIRNNVTTSREWIFPDRSGTVALVNDGGVYYTSMNGCISDADLSLGSSTFGTDNAAVLQAIFNLASATNPITIIVDGKYSIGSSIVYKSNTRIIIMSGCGFILRNGSNCNMFKNANPSITTTHTDQNITFESDGSGIINQNREGNPTHNTNTDGWLTPIKAWGVDRIKIKGIIFYAQRTFTTHIFNSNYIEFSGNYLDTGAAGTVNLVHTDGIHINGPAAHIIIKDNSLSQGDDGIALNANDVFQSITTGGTYDPYTTNGVISDFIIDNNEFRDGTGIRLLSTTHAVKKGTITNTRGSLAGRMLLADNWQGGTPALTGNGDFSDIVVDCTGLEMNFTSSLFYLGGTHKGITFKNIIRDNRVYNNASNIFEFLSNFYCDDFSLDGVQIIGGINSSPLISAGGYVKRLHVNNAKSNPTSQYGSITQPLLKMNATYGGRIEHLQLSNIFWDRCTSLIDYSIGQIDFIQLDNIIFTYVNAGLGAIQVASGRTVKDIVANNYTGGTPIVNGAGSYPTVRGSAFVGPLSGNNALQQLGTFTAADGTLLSAYAESGIGSTFSVQNSSDFQILSNVLVPTGTTPSGNLWYAVNNINTVDHEMQIEMKVTTAGAVAQVYMRWTNSTNYVVINLSSTLGSCNLTNVVAGVSTTFGSFSSAAVFTDSAWHRIRVSAVGTALSVYFDERLIASGTIPTVTTGTRAGWGCISASAPTVFSFDNYRGFNATYSGSVSKGFTLQKFTTTQKNALSMVAADAGYEIFDTTLAKKCVYSGTAWETVTSV